MSTQMQLRGGTTAENLLFTGAQREVTVDTDKNTLVVHDGITAGGFPLATEEAVSDGTFYFNDDTAGGSAANAYILAPKANTNTPTSYMDGIQLGFTTANANTGPSSANFIGLGVKNLKYRDGSDPLPGDISGRVYLIFDATSDWLEIQRKATAPPPQIRRIGASVSSNALTITAQPDTIDFRSITPSSGAVNTRALTSQISLVIPAGATLGTISAAPNRLAVVAVDNAGAVQLAACNFSGEINLDESQLINTTAISGAASSANVFYSASSLVGVPFRVLGYVGSTQTTAGSWAATPTNIQGEGGETIIGLQRAIIGTAVASTSGTSVDFTSLPPGIRRITIMFNSVSRSGISPIRVQLGTAAGVETTAYNSYGIRAGGTTIAGDASSAGFDFVSVLGADINSGQAILTRLSANIWVIDGALGCASYVCHTSGGKSLASDLSRIRITTRNGTDIFDNGSINILYEV